MASERKRDFYKAAILKTIKFLNTVNDETEEEDISAQYDRCVDSWNGFNEAHMEVLAATGNEEIAFQQIEFDAVDDLYMPALVQFKMLLNKFNTKEEEDFEDARSKGDADNDLNKYNGGLRVPYFKIPLFSGRYDDWPAFRDLFKSLIHFNNKMSSVQKLGYLKVNLTGEALQLIKNLEITDANYETAWNLLSDRYNNERVLVNRWINLIISLPISQGEAVDVKRILDGALEALQGLKNLRRPIEHYDDFLVYIIESKLDASSKQKWEDDVAKNQNNIPTWTQLATFLRTRFRALEVGNQLSSAGGKPSVQSSSASKPKSSTLNKAINLKSLEDACLFCNKNHRLNFCFAFQKKSRNDRQKFVDEKKLCVNCLTAGHKLTSCPSAYSCRICQQRHNTLLHVATNQPLEPLTTHLATQGCSTQILSTLLATAIIHIETSKGVTVQLRALIDQGSQVSFITSLAAKRLGIKGVSGGPSIKAIGFNSISTRGIATIEFSSYFNSESKFLATVSIVERISGKLPSELLNVHLPRHWRNLVLADENFYQPGPINVLLGAEVFSDIIAKGLLRTNNPGIIAQNSSLGWLLSGKIMQSSISPVVQACMVSENDQEGVDSLLKAFWEIEGLGSTRVLDVDDQTCEDFYDKSHYRDAEGRYVVRLPFKTSFGNSLHLGNSRNRAVNQWLNMEKRLERFPELRHQYRQMMRNLLEMNYMEPVPSSEVDVSPQLACYLPHHMVTKTGKNRIVFNASQKTASGVSLNDILLTGPSLQKELFDIILHVRQFSIAFSADVVKMFRQFRINKLDVDYQRIVWRESSHWPIQDYRLLTVLDGTSCAPYLAIKTIATLAEDERLNYPLACSIAERDMYMDDLFSGTHDSKTAMVARDQLISLFESAGMELRKWSSNDEDFLNSLSSDLREIPVELGDEDVIKTLGIHWTPLKDEFGYRIQLEETSSELTKRRLLSEAGKLFDPVGWVAPCTIIAKILFQSLWLTNLGWDDVLPLGIQNQWMNFRQDLRCLENVKIPRWTGNQETDKLIEFHGFADSSEKAYAAVVYVKVVDMQNNIKVTLLAAKTKVAPIKTISLPRLELCGALLLANLVEKVIKAMRFSKFEIHAHTDSRIVLAWLQSSPSRWKTFVANRTTEILSIIPAHKWHHVSGKENPADYASRGQCPSKLINNRLWWDGPSWLRDAAEAWQNSIEPIQVSPEVDMERNRKAFVVANLVVEPCWNLRTRFSSLNRLLRVTAYCYRFINNSRSPGEKVKGFLSTEELKMALQYWIKVTQEIHFNLDIDSLEAKKNLPKDSKLLNLNPMLDLYGILRVKGRLGNAELPFDRKHPIILPKDDHLTNLIIDDIHKRTLHGSIQLMLNIVRNKYWILKARSAVRQYVHQCNKCFRFSSQPAQQLMADLPSQRVNLSNTFSHSAVDYAGPIKIKLKKGPGKPIIVKGYISVFVCMATKAIHLELVGDYTSDAFIAAFKRFVSRRGQVSDIYSDNGTNFVGASEILLEDHQLAITTSEEEFAELLANDGVKWHFSPPSAPHFNGLAEAGVKSVKFHLRRIVGSVSLTYEELFTVLCEIEGVLNSRPISPLTDDASDLSALTPGHFLIGRAPISVPEPMLLDINENRLSRWQLLTKMKQDFWRSWSTEYLSAIQVRQKWLQAQPNLLVGQLVLVMEDNLPPSKWNLARILEVHPGADGLVRTVTIQTQTAVYQRPIVKLCPLPSNRTSSN